jgi:hypothetical protein
VWFAAAASVAHGKRTRRGAFFHAQLAYGFPRIGAGPSPTPARRRPYVVRACTVGPSPTQRAAALPLQPSTATVTAPSSRVRIIGGGRHSRRLTRRRGMARVASCAAARPAPPRLPPHG